MAEQGATTQSTSTTDTSRVLVEEAHPTSGSFTTVDTVLPFPGFLILIITSGFVGLVLVVIALMRGRPRNKS